MTEEKPPHRVREGRVLAYLVVAILGVYPLSIVFGAFAVVESLDPAAFFRALAASLAGAFLLYWCLRVVTRDRAARVQWLGVVLLLCGSYGIVTNTLRLRGWRITAEDPRWAIGYTVGAALVATLVVRPWRNVIRDLVPVAAVALVLVGSNVSRGAARWWNDPPPVWISVADVLTYAPLAAQKTRSAPSRDIYYILLDGLGRADTLKNIYGLDVGPFVSDLRARGFYIPDGARSNYPHTVLSFSSFLNLGYLDSIGTAVGRDFQSHAPVEYLIQHNALMRLAKQAGYEVVALGSDVAPTKSFGEADVCDCRQYGLSILEQATIAKTPLAAAPLDAFTYGGHRARVVASFDALEAGRESPARQFVFAHIMAPHPPFSFTPDGGFRRPNRPFMFNDGSDFEGSREEFVRGYRDQTAFVFQRLARIVQAILSRPGPKPVIVIHGDHGPGSRLQLNNPAGTDMAERMDIFAAYYFPDGDDHLYETITPVNASRVLANHYLGTDLPLLPDASFFSTITRPYEFVKVF